MVTGRVWDLDAELLIAPAEPPDVPADSEGLGLVLDGDDLPSPGLQVRIVGDVSGRVVRVRSWAEVPDSGWAWSISPSVGSATGNDEETSDRISDSVPKEWIRSIGGHRTPGGQWVVTLQVDRLTSEMTDWAAAQPPGSVLLYPFIAPTSLTTSSAIAGSPFPEGWE